MLTDFIDPKKITYLPNTAGCFTAEEAIRTLRLAREAGGWTLVKLEVLGEAKTLYPDMRETLRATEVLANEGFEPMVYCVDDPIAAKQLEEAGAVAVMPLGAPIGSGLGIQNRVTIRLIVEGASVPVLVDAGVGTASDAAVAMELGCDGVLMNTAIAEAKDPVLMARAMKLAVEAGRAVLPRRADGEAALRRSRQPARRADLTKAQSARRADLGLRLLRFRLSVRNQRLDQIADRLAEQADPVAVEVEFIEKGQLVGEPDPSQRNLELLGQFLALGEKRRVIVAEALEQGVLRGARRLAQLAVLFDRARLGLLEEGRLVNHDQRRLAGPAQGRRGRRPQRREHHQSLKIGVCVGDEFLSP